MKLLALFAVCLITVIADVNGLTACNSKKMSSGDEFSATFEAVYDLQSKRKAEVRSVQEVNGVKVWARSYCEGAIIPCNQCLDKITADAWTQCQYAVGVRLDLQSDVFCELRYENYEF